MKNAMKRVMSILLVAMLLVSALPLAASAKSMMDNLNNLPGQETKATQPAPVVPVVTEAPAAPAATEAPAAPAAAPATFSLFSARALSEETKDSDGKPVYFKFRLWDGTKATDLCDGKVFNHKGSIKISDAIATYLTDARKYSFTSVKWGDDSVSDRDTYEMQPESCSEDAPFRIVVTENNPIVMNVYIDGELLLTRYFYGTDTGETMLSQILPNWRNSYKQVSGGTPSSTVNLATSYKNGDEVNVYLAVKDSSTTTPSSSTTPSTPSSSTGATETTEYYNKFPYNVYLNIYKDTMVGAPDKTINITKGAALDGTVTMDEVKALVMNHYKAKDSYGISFDGLYLAEGTWVASYVGDENKYDKFVDVDQFRQYRTVYINVMIDNAVAKSTSSGTADTSNPKTGDSIYAPIAVLGVSATALAAAMFFYNKKRLAK